jgi:hypothetical protein
MQSYNPQGGAASERMPSAVLKTAFSAGIRKGGGETE